MKQRTGQRALAVVGFVAALGIALLLFRGRSPGPAAPDVALPSRPLAGSTAAERDRERQLRFWSQRAERDPADFIARNNLAAVYLQRVRETGSLDDLARASAAARASLAIVPADYNPAGLGSLAQAEFAQHHFTAARDLARQWARLKASKPEPYATLGDALLELGDYAGAEAAYRQMTDRDPDGFPTLVRRARLAQLRGRTDEAEHLLAAASRAATGTREPLAWCRWQQGELAFARGNYAAAEAHSRAALDVLPGYYRALGSLGRARAARGDLAGAIAQYEHAVRIRPEPVSLAALGDLYHLAGREPEAQAQYTLVERIGQLGRAQGALYNRQLALFAADHDRQPEAAFASAIREYADRKDIYGADALAWTACKAGHLAAAQEAIKGALRLGTQDALLFYHAGMIARAAGDRPAARRTLQRALSLNPRFDPLQAPIARASLEGGGEETR